MISKSPILVERRQLDPTLIDRYKAGHPKPLAKGTFRSLGLGLITGAADDDPSAIGTYAAAGASIGPSFLWTAPVTFPMVFSVVYLCSKLGQVAGQGLFAVIRAPYSKWLLYFFLITAVVGNIIEAGADLGGMAAALNVIVPVPIGGMVVLLGVAVLSLQLWGYTLKLPRCHRRTACAGSSVGPRSSARAALLCGRFRGAFHAAEPRTMRGE